MFWSGNYMVVRELNSLLKEENVTLTQVLEADDILQECKADNKALIQFLTRPDILAELITLITEEPPKNVELGLQYRHASIACEVLTSQLSTLSDRLSMDTVQMNRLCDFINRDPPLNPLLASYFSKTIEMLLERSPKQDWYLYHIVCLRVLDFLKARRDFLPNLLRHLHTSAAADALRCFVRLNDLFNKIVMEWFEEHQFLECLIQIICGTYEPAPVARAPAPAPEKGALDAQGKEVPTKESSEEPAPEGNKDEKSERDGASDKMQERVRAVASANAAALLCDIILGGEGCQTRSRTAAALVGAATSAAGVDSLLQGMFTAPSGVRRLALVHGAAVLLAMRRRADEGEDCERNGVELCVAPHLPLLHTALLQPPDPQVYTTSEAPGDGGGGESNMGAPLNTASEPAPTVPTVPEAPLVPEAPTVNLAPVILEAPIVNEAPMVAEASVASAVEGATGDLTTTITTSIEGTASETEAPPRATLVVEGAEERSPPPPAPAPPPRAPVGAARLQLAALLAALAGSSVHEVASTMLTLGTPGVLLDLFFAHPDNNFLHAHVVALVHNALANRAYRTQYAAHILEECDLVNRLIDVYEENENKRGGCGVRSGHMGHVTQLLRTLAPLLDEGAAGGPGAGGPGASAQERWAAFSPRLHAAAQRLDTPLGGYYPSASTYETEGMLEVESAIYNTNYNETATYEPEEDEPDRNKFLKIADKRMLEQLGAWDGEGGDGESGDADPDEDAMWKEITGLRSAPEASLDAEQEAPWAAPAADAVPSEGWAHFSTENFGAPVDPFATDAFASDAFASDAFASDSFAGRESFGGSGAEKGDEEFTPFWGYQDKENEASAESSAEARLRALRLDAAAAPDAADGTGPLDPADGASPLDALSASLADNLRTAMSSMTPEVIANIVNANMTAPLPLEQNSASDSDVPSVPNVPSVPSASGDQAES